MEEEQRAKKKNNKGYDNPYLIGTCGPVCTKKKIDLGRPYWIPHPVSCHTPEAVTTVFKCS